MDEQVASVLRRAFLDREVEAVGDTGPSWNDQNRTVRVEFADGEPTYLKLVVDGNGTRIARESAVIDYVRANCEVPTPTVLASDADAEVPYLATAPMEGQNLLAAWQDADADERAAMAREVGRALAGVHAIRFEDHGRVGGGGAGGLELRTAPWTDVLVEQIGEMRSLASSDRFDHHFDEVIAAVEANRETLDDAPAALLHGDPARPNCFRTDDGIGFIDWENAHVGDPAREIHRARDQQFDSLRSAGPEQVVSAFREGYREQAGGLPAGFEDRRPVYEAVRFLGTSGFFDKWVEFADESPDELAEWTCEEMDRRLAEI